MTEFRVFHLLQRAHGALFRAADRRLQSAWGVTASQHGVLFLLAQEDGRPISAIAEALKMGKSSLTGLVDRMEAAGLIRREADATDARLQRIHIEKAGKAVVSQSLPETRRANAALLKPFSAVERLTIEKFLRHVADHADAIIEAAGEAETAKRKKSS